MPMIAVREYIAPSGKSAYARWFERLDAVAAARVATAVYRLSEGNFSNTKGVGAWVLETRIDFGPGYRVYFGKDGETVVILLGGSAKKDQQRAIEQAKAAWSEYKTFKALQRK
jgi:putative addiction module killer protein